MPSGNVGMTSTTPWGLLSLTNTTANPSFVVEDSASPDTTPFIINGDGFVGIGTSTPGAHVNIIGALCVDDETPTCGNASRTSGTIYSVAALSATLDLAESYPTKDATLAAGELVMLDAQNPVFVKRAENAAASLLAGVVSTKPGFWLGGFDDENYKEFTKLPIALAGRTPVKVTLEGGDIRIGDPLTVSSEAGKAKKAIQSGRILGYALENFTGASSTQQTIEVFVNLGYWIGPDLLNATSSAPVQQAPDNSSLLAQAVDAVKQWLESMKIYVEEGMVRIKKLFAEQVTTDELCVGRTCVNEAKLKELLDKNSVQSVQSSSSPPASEPEPASETASPSETAATEPAANENVADETASSTPQ
jgi:hypothetical protein